MPRYAIGSSLSAFVLVWSSARCSGSKEILRFGFHWCFCFSLLTPLFLHYMILSLFLVCVDVITEIDQTLTDEDRKDITKIEDKISNYCSKKGLGAEKNKVVCTLFPHLNRHSAITLIPSSVRSLVLSPSRCLLKMSVFVSWTRRTLSSVASSTVSTLPFPPLCRHWCYQDWGPQDDWCLQDEDVSVEGYSCWEKGEVCWLLWKDWYVLSLPPSLLY